MLNFVEYLMQECLTYMPNNIIEISALLTAIFTGILACYAYKGVDTWKKQLQSSTKHVIAKRMLYTVNESSYLIKQFNKEINCIFYFVNNYDESSKNYLNENNLIKLTSVKFKMEILKEEASAIFDSSIPSYEQIYSFTRDYIEKLNIILLFLKNKHDIDEIKKNSRITLEGYVPLVPNEEYSALQFMLKQPDYSSSHVELIDKVKSEIIPYLRYML